MNFNELKKNIKKDFTGLPVVKIAVLADSATQLFCIALKAWGYTQRLNIDIREADYDTIYQTVLDDESLLYSAAPDFVIIWQSTKKMVNAFYKETNEKKKQFAENNIDFLKDITSRISQKLKTNIIVFNFNEINDSVFGNFGNKAHLSFTYQLRKLNFLLMEFASQEPGVNVFDLSALQNTYGSAQMVSEKFYISTGNVIDIDFLPVVAKNITDIFLAYRGQFKKCVILDLDNTLWGGLIGDDGMDKIEIGELGIGKAFTEFQRWLIQLKDRGIILAVCSKNTEEIALEPFEKHPEMVLKLHDIAVFMANWENKADNLRQIQAVLNIGFDSMVFLDDNPAEREIIKRELPEVTIPDLPEDPAAYLSFLHGQNLFETASFTEADGKRNDQYREEAGRVVLQKKFTDEAGFLKSLEMIAEIKPADSFSLPRVAQLTQRSNQFNLRTVRYTEDELRSIAADPAKMVLTVSLKDKFGDYGLISVVITEVRLGKSLFIDTWIMSCRVLRRNVEDLVLNRLISLAESLGCERLCGEYLPTPKNGIVKEHYRNLGFTETNEKLWELSVEGYIPRNIFIN